MPCFSNRRWKSLLPRQAKYCLPWSVSTSLGLPQRWMPSSRHSCTKSWVCLSPSFQATTYRLWSSMKATRYTLWLWRARLKLVMSLCQRSPGLARSNRRITGFLRQRFAGAGVGGSAASFTARRILRGEAFTPLKRARKSRILRSPKWGKRCLTATMASASSGAKGFLPGLRPMRLSRLLGPPCSYFLTHMRRLRGFTPQRRAKSSVLCPAFLKVSTAFRLCSGLYTLWVFLGAGLARLAFKPARTWALNWLRQWYSMGLLTPCCLQKASPLPLRCSKALNKAAFCSGLSPACLLLGGLSGGMLLLGGCSGSVTTASFAPVGAVRRRWLCFA